MTKIKMLQIVLMNNHVLFCFINLVLNENVLAPSLEQELVEMSLAVSIFDTRFTFAITFPWIIKFLF